MDSSNCKECLIISRANEGAAHSPPHTPSTHCSGAPWQCNQLWYTHKSLLLQDCGASSYEAEQYVNQLAQGNESQTKMPSKRKQFTLSDVLPHSRPSKAHLPTPPPTLNRGEEHHFIPPPPPRSKQRQTKALRNYVNGVVVLLVYLPPLSPAISTFQTDRDSATDSD